MYGLFMRDTNVLRKLLSKSALKENEIEFYLYLKENPHCNIFEICKNTSLSKSSAYRSFEVLKSMDLINIHSESWKTDLSAAPLTGLVRKLEAKKRSQARLISELKLFDRADNLIGNSKIAGIEVFSDEEVYEKYLELSEAKYYSNLVYGDWEAFNNKHSLIRLEKEFIKNRFKGQRKCNLVLTNDGPNTREIINWDDKEKRTTKFSSRKNIEPVWINAFDGNNYVYIWNLSDRGNTFGTLIESKPVADFYKNFINSQCVGN